MCYDPLISPEDLPFVVGAEEQMSFHGQGLKKEFLIHTLQFSSGEPYQSD